MKDAYLDFVNSPFGARLARSLGLPKPEVLRRQRDDRPEFDGLAAIGAGPSPQLLDSVADVLARLGMIGVAHASAPDWLALAARRGSMTGRFEPVKPGESGEPASSARLAALLFDASGICASGELDALYAFFHDALRSLGKCGRIVVLGRPPESSPESSPNAPRRWVAQRALEGAVRSLGKEARRGITANLLYVAPGAEHDLEATLRFFLSPRSAYVSGQAVRIGPTSRPVASRNDGFDWQRPLAGRRAAVTGAARGIGAAIAAVLAAQGAEVVGIDVPSAHEALEATLRELGGRALPLDIAAPEAPAQCAAAFAERGLDIIVHNAGITRDKTLARMSEAAWHSVIDINLSAQERLDEALLEAGTLRDGARIICVSSISGIAGNAGQTNYAASKAGVIGRVESLAPRLRERGITINAVAPGFIETQMTAKIPFGLREAGRRMNSLSQGGQPVDVAQAIAWFAHPGSAGVTGQVLRVCGQSLIGA